jgi:DnaJ-class molecular chaperone
MPRKVTCQACGGGGTILVEVGNGHKGDGVRLVSVKCTGCGGSGQVEVPDDDDDNGTSGRRR